MSDPSPAPTVRTSADLGATEGIRIANPIEHGVEYRLLLGEDVFGVADAEGKLLASETRDRFGGAILLGIGWQQVLVLRTVGKRVLRLDPATARRILAWRGSAAWMARHQHATARIVLMISLVFGVLAAVALASASERPTVAHLSQACWPPFFLIAGLIGIVRPQAAFYAWMAAGWLALTVHSGFSDWWLLTPFTLGMALLAIAQWRFLRTL
jgi:hypothetical protein